MHIKTIDCNNHNFGVNLPILIIRDDILLLSIGHIFMALDIHETDTTLLISLEDVFKDDLKNVENYTCIAH